MTTTALLVLLVGAASGEAPVDLESVRSAARSVCRAPEFGVQKTELGWRWRDFEKEEAKANEPWELSALIGAILGRFLTVVVGVVGLGALVLLVVSVIRDRRRAQKETASAKAAERPATLFGLDLRPEAMPDDIIVAARRLWATGDHGGALSLLYRGALAYLIDQRQLRIPASATEGECIDLVARSAGTDVARPFALLTDAWLVTAYGHRTPADAQFERLLADWLPLLGKER